MLLKNYVFLISIFRIYILWDIDKLIILNKEFLKEFLKKFKSQL